MGNVFRGISEAMDGRREAHMDVLVAVPRKTYPTLRSRLKSLKRTEFKPQKVNEGDNPWP